MPSEDKVAAYFQTITPEILAPAEYTDWNAIEKKLTLLRREIALVQSLDKHNPITDLADLLPEHPRVLRVLQILIAHTPDRIYFSDRLKTIHFKLDELNLAASGPEALKRATTIAQTFFEMGLLDFLASVKSVEDVVKGVLIGLEPNARKNRRGSKLEVDMYALISAAAADVGKRHGVTLTVERQMFVELENERKKIDYVVVQDNAPRVAIEVNFYSVSGSKPSEVLGRAYPEVQSSLKTKGVGFVVITDGVGWNSMRPVMETAQKKLNHVINIHQARTGDLDRILDALLFPASAKRVA